MTRLVTFVDLREDRVSDRQICVSARHEAVLAEGGRALLLDDRGWTESGPSDVWSTISAEEIIETTRVVVGPDEPFGDHTPEDMEADHWAYLAQILQEYGIAADPAALRRLPHDVVLSERLLAHLTPRSRDVGPRERD